jgi:hypothetical protein
MFCKMSSRWSVLAAIRREARPTLFVASDLVLLGPHTGRALALLLDRRRAFVETLQASRSTMATTWRM